VIVTPADLACVASVPERRERNSGSAEEFFAFGLREKWDKSEKVEGAGWGRGKKEGERLPANPTILKNPFAHKWDF